MPDNIDVNAGKIITEGATIKDIGEELHAAAGRCNGKLTKQKPGAPGVWYLQSIWHILSKDGAIMKILQTVKKCPGGLMIVPLLLGAW